MNLTESLPFESLAQAVKARCAISRFRFLAGFPLRSLVGIASVAHPGLFHQDEVRNGRFPSLTSLAIGGGQARIAPLL